MSITAPEILFVADTHFRRKDLPGESRRRELFISFLQKARTGAAIFLLGDIFDFYFEYRSAVPKRYFDIFHTLRQCHTRGVQVHFLGGNHDFWTKDFFQNELGVMVHREKIHIACQGRKILCAHGDLVMKGDVGYKILKSILRNRAVVTAASLLHPDLLSAIAAAISKRSKSFRTGGHEGIARSLGATASERFFSEGNDIFVMGHIHYPLHMNDGGKEFVILGGWIEHFTYGKLADGRIVLETFTD